MQVQAFLEERIGKFIFYRSEGVGYQLFMKVDRVEEDHFIGQTFFEVTHDSMMEIDSVRLVSLNHLVEVGIPDDRSNKLLQKYWSQRNKS
jgi:hypothetical protein